MSNYKINDLVLIINTNGLYASMSDHIGKIGRIVELDPYVTPPIKIEFLNKSTVDFYEVNVRIATQREIQIYNSHLLPDPWRQA